LPSLLTSPVNADESVAEGLAHEDQWRCENVISDQKEVAVYVGRRSWRCWRTRRLLARRGYRFDVINTSDNSQLRSWLTRFTGRKTLPYVFVDDRPVGGLGEIRALERSGRLDNLVRGKV
jgi:glutaredoxin 3